MIHHSLNRREFLTTSLAASAATLVRAESQSPASAAAQANAEIWRRFIDPYGIMIDFADLDGHVSLPTPEECRDGKPNALGWWSPIENGAMFNGLYVEAALLRWKRTGDAKDADHARRLMEGLLLLNSISEVKGFVGRGVSTDGKSHYPMGSNDQTLPWFLGLWRYWKSDLATPEEKQRIRKHLEETAKEIIRLDWRMPAEPPFGTRGSFRGHHFEEVARMLFTLQMLHDVTGDQHWSDLYEAEQTNRGGVHQLTKLEICGEGMAFFYAKTHNWTSCTAVGALRGLWEMEKDPKRKETYRRGLVASASLAAESLSLAQKFDPADSSTFVMDWRVMNADWKPQKSERDAQELAMQQLKPFMRLAPRRGRETAYIREPTSAAWIVTLSPDSEPIKKRLYELNQVITRYDYTKLYYSQFFWSEMAWERLQILGL